MKFGLSAAQYELILELVVEPIHKHGGLVYCYGSRARGDYKKFSDLDLMIESEKDLSDVSFKIQEKLSNSNFPYKVDLVQLKDFAESYLPSYERDRVLVG